MRLSHDHFVLSLSLILLVVHLPFSLGKECLTPLEDRESFGGVGFSFRHIVNQYLDGNDQTRANIIDKHGPIEEWCFKKRIRQGMTHLFYKRADFNADISKWDVSNITSFNGMFYGATSFNQNIGAWNVSGAHSVNRMFYNAKSFNQDLSQWDVSQSVNLYGMFQGASAFNGNVSTWNVSRGRRFEMMFQGATSFQGNLSAWDLNPDSDLHGMFMDTNYNAVGNAPFCTDSCFQVETPSPECPFSFHMDALDIALASARKISVIVPRIIAALSMFSSLYVIKGLIGTRRNREKNMQFSFHRMLLGISIFDFSSSFGYFFMDWAVPKDPLPTNSHEPDWCLDLWYYRMDFPFAAGTIATCTAQGFFVQIGIVGSILFTGMLSLSSMWTIRYNWKEPKLRKVERVCVPIIVCYALGSAIYFAAIGQFNPSPTGFCWLMPYPHQALTWGEGYEWDAIPENYRGEDNWMLYQLIGGQIWAGVVLLTILVSMSMVYCYVRGLTRRNMRYGESTYNMQGQSSSLSCKGGLGLNDKEKLIVKKGIQYTGVFVIMYVPAIVLQVVYVEWNYVELVVTILLTCQGIFNALIYGNAFKFKINCPSFCSIKKILSSIRSRGSSARDEPPVENQNGGQDNDSENLPMSVQFSKSMQMEKSQSMHMNKKGTVKEQQDIPAFKNVSEEEKVEDAAVDDKKEDAPISLGDGSDSSPTINPEMPQVAGDDASGAPKTTEGCFEKSGSDLPKSSILGWSSSAKEV